MIFLGKQLSSLNFDEDFLPKKNFLEKKAGKKFTIDISAENFLEIFFKFFPELKNLEKSAILQKVAEYE